jgi:uncharacterized protein YsxB (DUF464 family)
MIIINLSETTDTLQVEVMGHGDDKDQSCARVSTVCDCIFLGFKEQLEKYEKHNGYTLLIANKKKLGRKAVLLLRYLEYLEVLKELYPNSIKIENTTNKEKTNGKNN